MSISTAEQEIIAALNSGLQTADDGTMSCPVCHDVQRAKQSYGPHWRRAHFVKLTKQAQLEVDGMSECDRCGMVVAHIAVHRREHHPSNVPARVNGKSHSTPPVDQLELVDPVDDPTREVSPVDAGLAILAGLRPGSTISVEQLPDVVEWLQSTEHVVGLFKR